MLTTQYIPEVDIGERAWIWWDAVATLADGAVASWPDKMGGTLATQVTSADQPVMSAAGGGVLNQTGSKFLNFPTITDPKLHHWFMVVFKIDFTSTTASSGNLCSVNGFATGDGRSPFFGFSKSGANTLSAQWAGSGHTSTLTLPAPADNVWHIAVSRLDVNGYHYFSIDGGTELVDTTGLPVLQKSVTNSLGQIGDNNNNTITWTLAHYLIGQDIIDADDVARMSAAFMWQKGVQANLPITSPYLLKQPGSKGFWPTPYPFITQTAFQALEGSTPNNVPGFWQSPALIANYGNSIASLIAGMTREYFEGFDDVTHVGTELANPSPATVFGPTIDTTGGVEQLRQPGQAPLSVYTVANSELQILMQQVTPGYPNIWYSGAITSVNLAGRGYTFDPSVAPYFAAMNARLLPGNHFGPWMAFWLKPLEVFFNATTPYFEIDVVETYASSGFPILGSGPVVLGNNIHCSLHHWSGARNYQGRGTGANSDYNSHQFASPDINGGYPYDGSYHEYGCLIDQRLGYIVYTYDRQELCRCPIPPSVLQPTFFIADLAMISVDVQNALGTYLDAIDYIQVMRGIAY